ncbi:AcrR family transcriptional regulator [Povalibacter uvarum]|jgi:AcrR family transcriptional regulator|uniref:AcrR family transcriptional regulator n=1 Tax=Povalibacter uvarum TaxID=732238 RepID=A0A841HME1_9GAMM|nr:TetR/AcrR family transcriptional regulator [Povalibacter uvarum]MBB6093519.1 AcrR family transcriptional regulator [Povalibacter uvarum]
MLKKTTKKTTEEESSTPRDADRSMQDILAIATEEFAVNGLSGARVDQIAERTRTSKRMIYYYFNGKEGLYQAVLEKAYMDIRSLEERSKLLDMEPLAAMRKLIELTFDYDETHPQFISLVSVENIHQGKHMKNVQAIKDVNASVIRTLSTILERGRKEGVFRADLDPVDVHLLISAFCFFRVSNRHTFGAIFDRDLSDPKLRKRHKKLITETIERMLEVRPKKA